MKTKTIFILALAALLCACNNNPVEDISLIEGAWQLDKIVGDGMVSFDDKGEGHYTAGEHTDTYGNKQLVWLLKEGHKSEWIYSQEYKMWDDYLCDCEEKYSVDTEGDKKLLIINSRSTIPNFMPRRITMHYNQMPFPSSRYEITKLTKKNMVLETDGEYLVAPDRTSQMVHLTYYFTRENTLEDFIKKYEELENNYSE